MAHRKSSASLKAMTYTSKHKEKILKARKLVEAPKIRFQMQARFFPAENVVDRCIGQAELVIADAILLRGISVLQQGRCGKLSLRFPTFGSEKDSYVIPEDKAAYMQMLHVVRMAVKENGFHTAEIKGTTALSLFLRQTPAGFATTDVFFDLHY